MKTIMGISSVKWGLSGVACLLLAACHTTPEPNYMVTEIISEPPGAKIEVNGDYIGEAPVKTKIPTHADGVVLNRTVIRAIPTESGHYVQTKVYETPQFPFDRRRDQAPQRVYFDMTLEREVGRVGPRSEPQYRKTGPSSVPESGNGTSSQPEAERAVDGAK